MKKIIWVILFFTVTLAYAEKGFKTQYSETDTSYQIDFVLTNWDLEVKNIDNILYQYISFSNSTKTNKKGWAELPFISASIQLPAQKNVSLRILSSEYIEVQLEYPLLPSRGTIYRNQNPDTIPYRIAPESIIDNFYPGDLTEMEEPFIIRTVRGTTVRVFPFQYLAKEQTLRIYSDIKVELVFNKEEATNPLLNDRNIMNHEEEGLYRSIFLNFNSNRASATLPVAEYGDILVLTPSAYSTTIDSYIQWKREKGYRVTKQVVNNGANVTTAIQTAYNQNPNLMFVQLVGDWADIKSNTLASEGYAPTDPALGCVAGNDDYPDVAIGRFSCSGIADLQIQINKAIQYEKEPNMEPNWRETFIGIASDEGPGDDNEYDYTHIQRIYTQRLANFTYQTHKQNYDPGASSATLASHVNAGASTIAYCGHGSSNSFVTTSYNNTQVNNSTNGDKLPFIVSVACINGAFHESSVCFAETWLRKDNGGAVVTWMSTINQPWDPPQRGQDYFYDILTGGFNYDNYSDQSGYNTNEQRTHWGAITVNAANLMLMESSYTSDISTVKTWTTFGDASLQLRTKRPDSLILSNTIVPLGSNFIGRATVNGAPMQNVLICISQNGNYFSGLTDVNGNYSIPHTLTPGNVLLVATAFNTTTIYQQTQCTGDVCEGVSNLVIETDSVTVTLSWDSPNNDSVTAYNIYRNGNLVATVTNLNFVESNLLNGVYHYCVAAVYGGTECYDFVCEDVEVDDGINHDCSEIDNLQLTVNGNQVQINWQAPDVTNAIFEDVESHTAFTINSAGALGWEYIDGDRGYTYTISRYSFTNQGSRMAYIVFDPSQVSPTSGSTPLSQGEGFPAYSGSKFFASFASRTPPNNDWLISPELDFSGDGTFSFYARGGHKTEYVESFKVGYSTSGIAQEDFTILATVSQVPFEWTQYSYTIPAGTKRVAIQCTSNNQYYLCIDDILIQDNNPTTIASYQVYYDGNYIGSTTETSFLHTEATQGTHSYCVEITYSNGCVAYPLCQDIQITQDTYTIQATATTGGTISPAGAIGVLRNENKTFTITAATEHRIKAVYVDDIDQGAITSYTFSNVVANHTIHAVFEKNETGISTTATENIILSPNPVRQTLTIEATNIEHITIYNLLGQTVFSQPMQSEKIQINMEEYKDGVYFVRLRKGNDIITRKIIKNS